MTTRKLAYFVCKQGRFRRSLQVVNWDEVYDIRPDGIVVTLGADAATQRPAHFADLAGCELWIDAERCVGKVTDYAIDINTGQVLCCLFVAQEKGAASKTLYRLPMEHVLGISRGRLQITKTALQQATEDSDQGAWASV